MLAAQTRLAQELYRRPELYEVYLVELLALFADKGVAIQNIAISNHDIKVRNTHHCVCHPTHTPEYPDGRYD